MIPVGAVDIQAFSVSREQTPTGRPTDSIQRGRVGRGPSLQSSCCRRRSVLARSQLCVMVSDCYLHP